MTDRSKTQIPLDQLGNEDDRMENIYSYATQSYQSHGEVAVQLSHSNKTEIQSRKSMGSSCNMVVYLAALSILTLVSIVISAVSLTMLLQLQARVSKNFNETQINLTKVTSSVEKVDNKYRAIITEFGGFNSRVTKTEKLWNAPHLSAASCNDLKVKYGVNISGYYTIRGKQNSFVEVSFCDFTIYPGAQSCGDLQELYNISQAGYYMFGSNATNAVFHFCVPTAIGFYTCQQLLQRYPQLLRQTGFFKFQTPGLRPFRVFCNFGQIPVTTEITHNLTTEERLIENSCEPAGCFSAAPLYDVTGSDLVKIINSSSSCRQFIRLKCQGVTILRYGMSWWVSRNDEKMRYWGGSLTTGYCTCGETGSCVSNSYKCNCDQNSRSIVTSDEGYLSDKSKLPVKEIRVGDMGLESEQAWYTIGDLECSGQA